jgi:hypothetical protein
LHLNRFADGAVVQVQALQKKGFTFEFSWLPASRAAFRDDCSAAIVSNRSFAVVP